MQPQNGPSYEGFQIDFDDNYHAGEPFQDNEIERLNAENERLKVQNKELTEENEKLKAVEFQNTQLSKENERLKAELAALMAEKKA